jgi:hypothetical protein
MQENAFNTNFACYITGEKREAPKAKRKYIKVHERFVAESAAKRTAALLAFKDSQISIPSPEAEDRSRAVRGKRIGV